MRAIRPEGAQQLRTHKPEAIIWQCINRMIKKFFADEKVIYWQKEICMPVKQSGRPAG